MTEFNQDVRAGFAHVLEGVSKGVGELYGIELERMDANDPTIRLELPDGAAFMMAIVFGLCSVLMMESDAKATVYLKEMSDKMMPYVILSGKEPEMEGEPN
jgi:hypothetical protein